MDYQECLSRLISAAQLGVMLRCVPERQQEPEIRELVGVASPQLVPLMQPDDRPVLLVVASLDNLRRPACLLLTETRAIRVPLKIGLFGGKALPADVVTYEELRKAGIETTTTPQVRDGSTWMPIQTVTSTGWSVAVLDSELWRVWIAAGQVILGLAELSFEDDGRISGLKVGGDTAHEDADDAPA